ncbi:MAG: patatin-like phospholipase family protein [Pyrinomonadaceae bacterium]
MSASQRKKVGLVLSGGGARGFSHVGVVKVLAENNIPIDMIAGTSAGSFVGGALASGLSADEVVDIANKIGWLNMTRPSFSTKGFLSNAPMGRFIEANFSVRRFEDLKIPFAAVAYDIEKNEVVVHKDTGELAFAIRTSCAVPGVFMPLRDTSGRLLVDGGVVSPMPTDIARAMGAEIVIAVDLMACGATFRSTPRSGLGITFKAALALLRTAAAAQRPLADILIDPQIAHLRPDQIGKRPEFIRLGEEAANSQIDKIKDLL